MGIVALAGGIGAGKFLRGLRRVVGDRSLTVVGNTADDLVAHGLHVSPDLDSVLYWLTGTGDRERGWGRGGESFRAIEELRRLDPEGAWFGLGDLDLAVHLFRTGRLERGMPLSVATAQLAEAFGLEVILLPMSDDTVETRIHAEVDGVATDLHLQEYWVRRGGRDPVVRIEYRGAAAARPGPGVIEAIASADSIVICPSNPAISIGPILAVPGIRDAVAARRSVTVGVSGIVAGAPLGGMADRMMPAMGVEVSAAGAASCYEGLLGAWLIDEADRGLAPSIEATGVRVGIADTIMRDDDIAESVARVALELLT